ncbi:MAG: Asp-tRNA(Asn)/Glu-tRNA(Gln) amidotransferase subunit GatB, partial [Acidobacteria bacterium]|nr:Asp-tRNA(Asn)/Glu-tRNA(Gln) amidotransferase subunit GatB [Acidobacteriota bacterium]
MDYEAVIGLEVHVQLLTETKLFCRCANRFGGTPNTRVCPICLGYPGALPVVNRRAVELATRLALACGCAVAERSSFARKSYFYPDLPKGYQISQNDAPLARHGWLPLARHDRRIPIERMHLEEDAGKLLHHEATDGLGETWVDFNRCGTPLVEIVSAPELSSPDEAHDFLESLRQLVRYTGASDGNLEEGSLRCDANVSLRGRGSASTGTRVEIKNLNSFRFVARALEHEIERQGEILARGGKVAAETRSFDTATGKTRAMRSKESSDEYRYFPEPDLGDLDMPRVRLETLRGELPELPWAVRRRFVDALRLDPETARLLAESR